MTGFDRRFPRALREGLEHVSIEGKSPVTTAERRQRPANVSSSQRIRPIRETGSIEFPDKATIRRVHRV